MCRTSQAKFWPKKPVMNVSGRKTVASTVSCSMVAFCRTLTLVCSTESTATLACSTVPSRSHCAVEVGRLAPQRVDPLGGRDAAGEHGGLDLVDVALEPGNDGRIVVNDFVQDRPERG